MSYGKLSIRGSFVFRWKDSIDRTWMEKFHDFFEKQPRTQEEIKAQQAMRCGGCGSKIPAAIIDKVLSEVKFSHQTQAKILSGSESVEDAAVYELPPRARESDSVQLQTVDFFKQFLHDPYVFGQIAANNALSDIFAMNGTPYCAQALVTLPQGSEKTQRHLLHQMMEGASEFLSQHQVAVIGGHTSEAQDVGLGFSVNGYANKSKLFHKTGLEPSQKLILTKPLGTGALLVALMRGQLSAINYSNLISSMLMSNHKAQSLFAKNGVNCCTDVTGFGLAGHLREMIADTPVSVELYTQNIPRFAAFDSLWEKGIKSTLFDANFEVRTQVSGKHDPILFDPQTSGGLLGAVPEAHCETVLDQLRNAGATAAIVGGVVPQREHPIHSF